MVETVENIGVKNYRLTWEHDSLIGNLVPSITWSKGRRVRFTIETRDAWKRGSRTSASGRHMRKASWEAHRDVMAALFDADHGATIKTAFATYRGRKDFHDTFGITPRRIPNYSGNGKMHNTDTRCAWCDYIDAMSKDNQISQELAQRATLD